MQVRTVCGFCVGSPRLAVTLVAQAPVASIPLPGLPGAPRAAQWFESLEGWDMQRPKVPTADAARYGKVGPYLAALCGWYGSSRAIVHEAGFHHWPRALSRAQGGRGSPGVVVEALLSEQDECGKGEMERRGIPVCSHEVVALAQADALLIAEKGGHQAWRGAWLPFLQAWLQAWCLAPPQPEEPNPCRILAIMMEQSDPAGAARLQRDIEAAVEVHQRWLLDAEIVVDSLSRRSILATYILAPATHPASELGRAHAEWRAARVARGGGMPGAAWPEETPC